MSLFASLAGVAIGDVPLECRYSGRSVETGRGRNRIYSCIAVARRRGMEVQELFLSVGEFLKLRSGIILGEPEIGLHEPWPIHVEN